MPRTESGARALSPAAGTLTDEEIVARVCAGERALYELLVRRNNARLYRAIRGLLHDEAEIEDAMQQAYVAAYLHLGDFAGKARFSTWLVRIGIHEALGRLRRVRSHGADLMDLPDLDTDAALASDDASPEERAATREIHGVVERAIDALPGGYRVVFMLREVDELSTADTAEALGLTEEAVKVRLHRAKAKVRACVLAGVDAAARDAFPFLRPRCDRMVAAVMAAVGATR